MPNPALNIEVLLEPVRLRRFLQQQRWFGAKARSIASVQLADVLDIGDLAWLTLIRVEFESGVGHEYLLPLAIVDASTAAFDAVGGHAILPAEARNADALLRAYVVDKAIYEIGYELNNRPDWVAIPLTGVLQWADGTSTMPGKVE